MKNILWADTVSILQIDFFNPFVPNAPFLFPLKTFGRLQEVAKGYIGNYWVNKENNNPCSFHISKYRNFLLLLKYDKTVNIINLHKRLKYSNKSLNHEQRKFT